MEAEVVREFGDTIPKSLQAVSLTATADGHDAIDLSWNTAGALHRSTEQGFTPESGNRLGSYTTETETTDSGLAPETTYYCFFKVELTGYEVLL